MNLTILSELNPQWTHVGWSVSHGLEAVLAELLQPTFIYPEAAQPYRLLRSLGITDSIYDSRERHLHKVFPSLFTVKDLPKDLPSLGSGKNILLVIGMTPAFLRALDPLRPLLPQFDLRVAYLLDSFDPSWMPQPVSCLDHLFVISPELAAAVHQHHRLTTTYLPLAVDTTQFPCPAGSRWIDILNYGRTNPAVHQCLQQHFNQFTPERLYFHSTFARPQVHNPREHFVLMRKLLSRSKISLCFEASQIARFFGCSPLLYRWFEAWAAGCTIVGTRPFGQGVAELMDWENSMLQIPENPSEWIPYFEAILEDQVTLALNTRRNYQQALLRHDWRYRIRQMLITLELPVPDQLNGAIARLQEQAVGFSTSSLRRSKSA